MLCSFFCSVPTFEFDSITSSCKTALACNFFCMSHLLEGLEPYQYAPVPSPSPSPPSTFPSPFKSFDDCKESPNLPSEHVGIWSFALIKTQILLLDSKFCTVSKAKDLTYTKKHTQTLASSLRNFSFPPAPHSLDSFRPLLQSANIVNEIGSLYSRLQFGRKCTMHWQLIEVEMQRLTVLIEQITDQHKELKQELEFVIMSEQRQAKQLATLRKVKKSNAAIKKDLTAHKTSLQAH